jgi:hypothetical protein
MKFTALSPLLVLPIVAAWSLAQPTTAAVDPDAPNLVHSRHHHAHTSRHPTTRSAARFTTSRPDAIQLPLPTETEAFTFVVFGDRTGGPPEGVNVLADAVRDTNLLAPDMVLTVGDLIQGYNEDAEWKQQAREYKSIMDKLVCPWFPVAGNHDVYWRDKDQSGDPKPPGEHEKNFETHFGPLWYAFEHKDSWFIVLYSDEGNPETGEKNISKPESQQMSQEQFDWLRDTLAKAKDAKHVFLFLHHPRWVGGTDGHTGYGNSWDRVHELLVSAGNVTAVFGGHIHRMRYDPRDGIEYVTLATTGGGQSNTVPQAGWLHHYHVVTVRPDEVAMAAFPVGAAMDVREITGTLAAEMEKLTRALPTVDRRIALSADGSADATINVKITNPTTRPVEYTLVPDSKDSRWLASPDHDHVTLAGGESATMRFAVRRVASPIDDTLRFLEIVVDADYLAPGHRYAVPTRRVPAPIDLTHVPAADHVLAFRDGGALPIPDAYLDLPGQAFTLEGRFLARSFKPRNGLLSKMQNSGYGIFISEGKLTSSVFLDDKYQTLRASDRHALEPGRWYHVAQVFDGAEQRLYLDGVLVARGTREGATLKDNTLPLIVGGDVAGNGDAVDTLDGLVDAVRISSVARYAGDRFTPPDRHAADEHTLVLLNLDRTIGSYLLDESPRGLQFPLPKKATLEPR